MWRFPGWILAAVRKWRRNAAVSDPPHRGSSGKCGLDTCSGIDCHDPNGSEPPAPECGHHGRESFTRLPVRLLPILHVLFRRSRLVLAASSDRCFDRLRHGLVPSNAPGVLPVPPQTGEAVKHRLKRCRRRTYTQFHPRAGALGPAHNFRSEPHCVRSGIFKPAARSVASRPRPDLL